MKENERSQQANKRRRRRRSRSRQRDPQQANANAKATGTNGTNGTSTGTTGTGNKKAKGQAQGAQPSTKAAGTSGAKNATRTAAAHGGAKNSGAKQSGGKNHQRGLGPNQRGNRQRNQATGKNADGASASAQRPGGAAPLGPTGATATTASPANMAKVPHGLASHEGGTDQAGSTGAGNREERSTRTRRGAASREGGLAREGGRESVRETRRRRRRRASRTPDQGGARTATRHRGGKKTYATTRYGANKMETRDETSAGGLVVSGLAESVDEAGNVDLTRVYVALIGRLDRRGRLLWSMPKGHVEPGEDIAATAEREVWEETGIHGEVFAELGVIDYWFVSEGTRIHKTVHHHLLRYVDGDLNDEDPEVTEVAWIPASALIEHFAYADERKLARIAHDLLPQLAVKEHKAGRMTPR